MVLTLTEEQHELLDRMESVAEDVRLKARSEGTHTSKAAILADIVLEFLDGITPKDETPTGKRVVLVTPHSTASNSLAATATVLSTIQPIGGHLCRRAADGALILKDGKLVVDSVNPDFLIFAVKQQGYAASAELDPAPEQ